MSRLCCVHNVSSLSWFCFGDVFSEPLNTLLSNFMPVPAYISEGGIYALGSHAVADSVCLSVRL